MSIELTRSTWNYELSTTVAWMLTVFEPKDLYQVRWSFLAFIIGNFAFFFHAWKAKATYHLSKTFSFDLQLAKPRNPFPRLIEHFWIFAAVEFIHGNFSDFLGSPGVITSDPVNVFEGGSSTSDELTRLLLDLLKVNGSPLLDITLDISPRNASRYIGVIRVPGKAAILPKLTHSNRDFGMFRKWVCFLELFYFRPQNSAEKTKTETALKSLDLVKWLDTKPEKINAVKAKRGVHSLRKVKALMKASQIDC